MEHEVDVRAPCRDDRIDTHRERGHREHRAARFPVAAPRDETQAENHGGDHHPRRRVDERARIEGVAETDSADRDSDERQQHPRNFAEPVPGRDQMHVLGKERGWIHARAISSK